MVQVGKLLEMHVHLGVRGDALEGLRDVREPQERGRAPQVEAGEPRLDGVLDVDLQVRQPVEQERHRHAEAGEDTGEQVGGDHDDKGDGVGRELEEPVPLQVPDGVPVHELESGDDEHRRQGRHRNETEQAPAEGGEEQDPQAMEDGRHAGAAPGLDVGAGTNGDRGHRQGAQQAADAVAHTLGDQLPVVVGPGAAATQLVESPCAQEGLGGGHRGQAEGLEPDAHVQEFAGVGVDRLGEEVRR